jgi:hypothetical protein
VRGCPTPSSPLELEIYPPCSSYPCCSQKFPRLFQPTRCRLQDMPLPSERRNTEKRPFSAHSFNFHQYYILLPRHLLNQGPSIILSPIFHYFVMAPVDPGTRTKGAGPLLLLLRSRTGTSRAERYWAQPRPKSFDPWLCLQRCDWQRHLSNASG